MTRQIKLSASLTLAAIAAGVAPLHSTLLAQLARVTPEITLGAAPTIIGPGVVSTPAEEFRAAMSPDNRTIVYVLTDRTFRHMTLVQAERNGKGWATPEVVSFSGIWRDGDPAFAPDGRTLFFISNRPMPGDPPDTARRDYNIWYVSRHADGGWGDPVALGRSINTSGQEMSPSVTSSGTLYFSRGDKIMRAEKSASGYSAPSVVSLNASGAGDPSISADERYIVFDADGLAAGDVDIYLSCRTANGWAPASRFASPVNTLTEEGDPSVSADGRTLYFFSRRLVSSPDRAPRKQRATYTEVAREAVDNIYNGSRNLYSVDLSSFSCRVK